MKSPYTLAVIGCGAGGKLSMEGAAASDQFQLVAAVDLRPDALAAAAVEFPGLKTFTEPEAMLDAVAPDVVCVSTYAPSHEALTRLALDRGVKGLLVEKPLSHSSRSGAAVLDAIRSRGVPVVVPHGLLTRASGVAVLNHLRKGAIGELRSFEVLCTGWDLLNAGIHWLHFFLNCIDPDDVRSVMSSRDTSTRTYRDGVQVETTATTIIESIGAVRAYITTGDEVETGVPGRKTVFRLAGTLGMLEFYGWPTQYRLWNAEHPTGKGLEAVLLDCEGHQKHLENLAQQMRGGTTNYRLAETSLRALEVIEAAYLSAREHCKVTFPLSEFSPPTLTDWEPGQPYLPEMGGRNGRQLP